MLYIFYREEHLKLNYKIENLTEKVKGQYKVTDN